MPKMNLAFLLTHSGEGGALNLWADLTNALREKGHSVTLVALYPDGSELSTQNRFEGSITYVSQYRPRSPLDIIRVAWALRCYLLKQQYDVLFSALPLANVMAPLAELFSGIKTKIIISHHGPVHTANRWIDRLDALLGMTPYVARVLCVSEAVSASLRGRRAIYRSKIAIVRNALPNNIQQVLDKLVSETAAREPGRVIAVTGRLAEQKNYPQLLRALVPLKNVHVKIIGDGPDKEDLIALAKALGVYDKVTFLGSFPRLQALAHLADSDLFVQVSRFEGHSLSLLEAAHLGLPIIVSRIPEQIEALKLEDGTLAGITVPLDDHDELSVSIEQVLGEPSQRYKFGKLARTIASQRSFAIVANEYEGLAATS